MEITDAAVITILWWNVVWWQKHCHFYEHSDRVWLISSGAKGRKRLIQHQGLKYEALHMLYFSELPRDVQQLLSEPGTLKWFALALQTCTRWASQSQAQQSCARSRFTTARFSPEDAKHQQALIVPQT